VTNRKQEIDQNELHNYFAGVLTTVPLDCNSGLPKHIKLVELKAMFDQLAASAQANCRSSQLALELIIRHAKITDSIQRQYENFM
jgi:hypothetical protein